MFRKFALIACTLIGMTSIVHSEIVDKPVICGESKNLQKVLDKNKMAVLRHEKDDGTHLVIYTDGGNRYLITEYSADYKYVCLIAEFSEKPDAGEFKPSIGDSIKQ